MIDTVPMITRCFQYVFSYYGHKTLTDADVHALFGPAESVIFSREFGDRWPEVLTTYLQCYRQGHATLSMSEDIMQLMKDLHGHGSKLAIVTNKERDTTDITLNHFDLAQMFDVVVTAEDVPQPKPQPYGILSALRTLAVDPSRAVLVGDTMNDVNAAHAAGVAVIQGTWFVPNPPLARGWMVADTIKLLRQLLLD